MNKEMKIQFILFIILLILFFSCGFIVNEFIFKGKKITEIKVYEEAEKCHKLKGNYSAYYWQADKEFKQKCVPPKETDLFNN